MADLSARDFLDRRAAGQADPADLDPDADGRWPRPSSATQRSARRSPTPSSASTPGGEVGPPRRLPRAEVPGRPDRLYAGRPAPRRVARRRLGDAGPGGRGPAAGVVRRPRPGPRARAGRDPGGAG